MLKLNIIIAIILGANISLFGGGEGKIELKSEHQFYIDSMSFRILVELKGITWYLENEIDYCIIYYCFDTLQMYDSLWSNCVYQINNYYNLDHKIINSYLDDDRYKIIYEIKKKMQINTYHGGYGDRAFTICVQKLKLPEINKIYSNSLQKVDE